MTGTGVAGVAGVQELQNETQFPASLALHLVPDNEQLL